MYKQDSDEGSGKSGPIADTEEESSTDWADCLGEEDDPGDEILES